MTLRKKLMARFPNLPQTRGETDDDASIHIYSQVGPVRLIINSKYDQQIMHILSRSGIYNESRCQDPKRLNDMFNDFVTDGNAVSDTDSEDTQVEEELPQKHHCLTTKDTENFSDKPNKNQTQLRLLPKFGLKFFAFLLGVISFFLFQLSAKRGNLVLNSHDVYLVSSRLRQMEDNVMALNNVSTVLDSRMDVVDAKQTEFFTSVRSDMDDFQAALMECMFNLTLHENGYQKLLGEMGDFSKKISSLELLAKMPLGLEGRLSVISQKLAQLTNASTDLHEIKHKIVEEFILTIQEHVSVYIRNNKIHYIPEFYRFLQSFAEMHNTKPSEDWKLFVEASKHDSKVYLEDLVKESQGLTMAKVELGKDPHQSVAEISDDPSTKYSRSITNQNETMLKLVSRGKYVVFDNSSDRSNKELDRVNYADYGRGSRILGFLTTAGRDSILQKSFSRIVFLGWYDFLNSNGLRAPNSMKHNANNILFDGGNYWQCETHWCSVGLRLSEPIILTDLILNNPSASRPSGLHVPTAISIYIRPRRKLQASELEEHYGPSDCNGPGSSKYLAKFHKVQEVKLSGKLSSEHVKLPSNLVSLKVIVRDIFLQITSDDGFTGLYNIKTYGRSELDVGEYGQKFDLLLRKPAHDALAPDLVSCEPNSKVMYTIEDDDYT